MLTDRHIYYTTLFSVNVLRFSTEEIWSVGLAKRRGFVARACGVTPLSVARLAKNALVIRNTLSTHRLKILV